MAIVRRAAVETVAVRPIRDCQHRVMVEAVELFRRRIVRVLIVIRLVVGAIDNTMDRVVGIKILATIHNGRKMPVSFNRLIKYEISFSQSVHTCFSHFRFMRADTKKKDATSGLPLWISDDLELWPEKDTPLRFTQIAALHSEFIAISTKGELHQWRWADTEPYRNHENPSIFHPKTQALNLIYEKVMHISATSIRCTVSTESNRVATWMDELLGMTGSKLEHSAVNFPEFQSEKIVSLYTCTLYTVARMENNNLYWWGVLPFGQRKRLWDKHKAKSKKPIRSSVSAGELTVGSQVCMKNSPMYQPGAIGFSISNGVPKVGQLMNAAWDLTDICRFKIVTIPPSSSSSSSAASSLTSSDLKDLVKAAGASGSSGGVAMVTAGTSSTSAAASKTSSGNNKETADRLDMPPPPSPASSTCSDTGSVTSHKRAKRAAPKEESDAKKDEEQWMLK